MLPGFPSVDHRSSGRRALHDLVGPDVLRPTRSAYQNATFSPSVMRGASVPRVLFCGRFTLEGRKRAPPHRDHVVPSGVPELALDRLEYKPIRPPPRFLAQISIAPFAFRASEVPLCFPGVFRIGRISRMIHPLPQTPQFLLHSPARVSPAAPRRLSSSPPFFQLVASFFRRGDRDWTAAEDAFPAPASSRAYRRPCRRVGRCG